MLKRIARENVNVSLTLPASLPFNRELAPRSATQSVEKSDSVTPPLEWALTFVFLILAAAVGGWIVGVCPACPANTMLAAFKGIRQ